MFSAQLHEKRAQDRLKQEQELSRTSKLRERNAVLRVMLAANYDKRIDQFILNMANDPIKIHEHQGPLQIVGRSSDPLKFKGSAAMIMKGYRTEQERIRDSVAAHTYVSLEPAHPQEFRARDPSKDINPNMYFTSKPNLKSKSVLKLKSKTISSNFNTRSSFLVSQSQPRSSQNTPQPVNQQSTPKFVTGLDRKIHFKGVMSRLVQRYQSAMDDDAVDNEDNIQMFHRTQTATLLWKHAKVLNRTGLQGGESTTMAKNVLESCQVIPKVMNETFLRTGGGKLISNPFQPTGEVYHKLYRSQPGVSSSFSL